MADVLDNLDLEKLLKKVLDQILEDHGYKTKFSIMGDSIIGTICLHVESDVNSVGDMLDEAEKIFDIFKDLKIFSFDNWEVYEEDGYVIRGKTYFIDWSKMPHDQIF